MNLESLTRKIGKIDNQPINESLKTIIRHLDPNMTGEYVGEQLQAVNYTRKVSEYKVVDIVNLLTADADFAPYAADVFSQKMEKQTQWEEFDEYQGYYKTTYIFFSGDTHIPNCELIVYGYDKGAIMIKDTKQTIVYTPIS